MRRSAAWVTAVCWLVVCSLCCASTAWGADGLQGAGDAGVVNKPDAGGADRGSTAHRPLTAAGPAAGGHSINWRATLLVGSLFALGIVGVFAALRVRASMEALRQSKRTALLVIAHPDDEAMFFVPMLQALRQARMQVFLLCLSTGNADGLGATRQKELLASAQLLGIPRPRVQCLDLADCQDGMDKHWNIASIKLAVAQSVRVNQIDSVFTFDMHGVSSHPNHIAVSSAVSELVHEGRLQVPAYTLTSTNILRKYCGLLDLGLSLLEGNLFLMNLNPLLVHSAMVAHASQYVWYRRLFVVFSRYSFLNTLERIRPE